jgi:hypothetical protein
MQELLPRELRDMVYTHLLDGSRGHNCCLDNGYIARSTGKDYPEYSVVDDYKHLGDIEYVGKETKTEMA